MSREKKEEKNFSHPAPRAACSLIAVSTWSSLHQSVWVWI